MGSKMVSYEKFKEALKRRGYSDEEAELFAARWRDRFEKAMVMHRRRLMKLRRESGKKER